VLRASKENPAEAGYSPLVNVRQAIAQNPADAPWIEREILYRLMTDFADPAFLARTIAEARRVPVSIEADPGALDGEIKRAETRLNNLLNLGAQAGDKAILAKIRELQAEVDRLRADKAAWGERTQLKECLKSLTERDLRNAPCLCCSAARS
jgi:hypothetical protein